MADPKRINALPNDDAPLNTDVLPIDSTTGGSTRSTSILKIVDTIAPVASDAEAKAGLDNLKRMTSLRTATSIIERTATPDDFADIQTAISTKRNVEGRPGAAYTHTGVSLGNSASFDGKNAIVSAAAGAAMYLLSAYRSVLERLYLSDNRPSTDFAIKVDTARYTKISDVVSANTGAGGISLIPSSGSTSLTNLSGLTFEGITGTGISIGSSVNEIQASRLYIHGKLDFDGSGKGRPQSGTIGWRQNTPVVGGNAVGGHQIVSAIMIDFDTGWWITDGQLSSYTGIIADDTRGYGIVIDGASQKLTFCNTYVGTSMGIRVAGTAQQIKFDCLETRFIGVIPPWGQNPFYNTVGPYYALTLEDTAQVTVNGDNWTGDKTASVASTAKLTVTGGVPFRGRTIGTVAAGATVYLAEYGQTTTEADATWRVPYDGYLFMIQAFPGAAPGAGESFTYTARINGADTALVAAITGAGVFAGKAYAATSIAVTEGQTVSIKLATSAGAVAARHGVNVQMLPK